MFENLRYCLVLVETINISTTCLAAPPPGYPANPGWDLDDPINITETREYFTLIYNARDLGIPFDHYAFTFTNPRPEIDYLLEVSAIELFSEVYADQLGPLGSEIGHIYDLIKVNPAVAAQYREYLTTGILITDIEAASKANLYELVDTANKKIIVDPAFVPAALAEGRREVQREQAAMTEIVERLDLSYTIRRFGELELPGTTPLQSGELAPIVLLPDVEQLKRWLGQVPPVEVAPPLYDVTYDDKHHAPYMSDGMVRGESVIFQSKPLGTKSGYKASKPWGVPEDDWNVYVDVELAGRFTNKIAVMQMGKHNELKPVGVVRTWLGTDRVWGYNIFDKMRSGNRIKPVQGWLFAIAEANSMPRTRDHLGDARSSSTTNHVETELIIDRWPKTLVPFIMPRPYSEIDDEYRTEAIVISDRMLDAANGVLMVRAAATWTEKYPDFVIDNNPANHARVLAVFIDHRVLSERLVEIVQALCQLNDKQNNKQGSPPGKMGEEQLDDESQHGLSAPVELFARIYAIRAGEYDLKLGLIR